MIELDLLLATHAFATIGMTGLVWFVQVVHYPLFVRVGRSDFPAYHDGHVVRTGRVVIPFMLLELGTAIGLALIAPAELRQLARWGLAGLAFVWGSTFLVQVPLHRRLGEADPGPDRDRLARRLVATNWIRTVGWTGRSVVALLLVLEGAG